MACPWYSFHQNCKWFSFGNSCVCRGVRLTSFCPQVVDWFWLTFRVFDWLMTSAHPMMRNFSVSHTTTTHIGRGKQTCVCVSCAASKNTAVVHQKARMHEKLHHATTAYEQVADIKSTTRRHAASMNTNSRMVTKTTRDIQTLKK